MSHAWNFYLQLPWNIQLSSPAVFISKLSSSTFITLSPVSDLLLLRSASFLETHLCRNYFLPTKSLLYLFSFISVLSSGFKNIVTFGHRNIIHKKHHVCRLWWSRTLSLFYCNQLPIVIHAKSLREKITKGLAQFVLQQCERRLEN